MTEQTQTSYYQGKFGDQRPTKRQLSLLEKLNIRQEVIRRLDRKTAFTLIEMQLERQRSRW
jgi:hypothetical protein